MQVSARVETDRVYAAVRQMQKYPAQSLRLLTVPLFADAEAGADTRAAIKLGKDAEAHAG